MADYAAGGLGGIGDGAKKMSRPTGTQLDSGASLPALRSFGEVAEEFRRRTGKKLTPNGVRLICARAENKLRMRLWEMIGDLGMDDERRIA